MDNVHQPTPTPTRMAVVSPRHVDISFWNQRLTRSEQTIQNLAMRLARDGFDPTRPIKVHLDPDLPDHYQAFAGGTRLLAAKRANLPEVYIAIYEGLTDPQIIQLSDKDNDDDEAHTQICVVDRWQWCQTLQGLGWSQAGIATAKNVKERSVYYWLQYANFPQSILDQFCTKDFLKESHARELVNFAQCANLAPFVTAELMTLEVIELAVARAGRGEGPTADQFRKLVEMYNLFLAKAQERYDQIANQRWQTEFVGRLAEAKARSVAEVDRIYTGLAREIEREARRSAQAAQDALAEQQRLVQEAAAEQQRRTLEARRAETYQAILANLMLGDARELLLQAPPGARLAFFDAPYGDNYNSRKNHRRYATARHAPMANDAGEAALELLAAILPTIYEKLADDAILLLWSGDTWLPEFREAVRVVGFTYRSTVIWFKKGHGAGDLTGDFAPQHEYLIYATKGNPKLSPPRLGSVLEGNEFLPGDHPTKKPVDLIEKLIHATTQVGDLILDPFAGIGSVPITAFKLGRRFWASEIEPHYHRAALDLLYTEVDGQIDILLQRINEEAGDPGSHSTETA